jgi:tetratricopeptide (TPR) repeat protein
MVVGGWVLALFLAQSPATRDYQRATELFSRNDLSGAESAVTQSLRSNPHYVPALILKARLAMIAGQMGVARQALQSAIAADLGDKGARFLLGFCYYLENDFENARSAFANADASDARVALYIGLSEEGLSHTDAAIEYYERSLKLDRINEEGRVAYSRLLRRQGKLDHAEALLEGAPESRSVLYEKGQCRFDRGDYGQAAQFGERALAAPGPAPGEREIRFLLVRAYQKAGKADLAARHRAIFESLPTPLVR